MKGDGRGMDQARVRIVTSGLVGLFETLEERWVFVRVRSPGESVSYGFSWLGIFEYEKG
jgi:hypothetical protein